MNKPRFSIRKYKKVVASVLLGFFVNGMNVVATSQKEIPVKYQYINETELSAEQKKLLIQQLPEKPDSTTVYVVYRKNSPINLKNNIETGDSSLMYFGMIAFVVVGYQLIKDKKKTKKVITSVIALTTFGTSFYLPVEAFSELAQYNTTHYVLETLPDGQISIPGFNFLGYLPTEKNIFVEKEEQGIDFEEIIELDDQLAVNERKVEVVGKKGKIITEQYYYVIDNQKVIFNQIITREEPVKQVVKYGTKKIVENGITTEVVTQRFEEIVEYDTSLWADSYQVLQEGIDGKVTVKKNNDGSVIETTPLISKQDRKIKRGTKPLLGVSTTKEIKEIDFDVEYLYDDSKYRDEEVIEVNGEKGIQELVYTYQTFRGVKQGNPHIQINEIKPKVNRVIRVGTKEVERKEIVRESKVTAFTEKVVYDDNRWEDEEFVSQEGQNLVEEVTTTYNVVRDVRQSNPIVTTKVITPLKEKIITKGTKPIEKEVVEKKEQSVPFETHYIQDNTKYVDEEIVEQIGKVGKKEITTTYKTIKGIKQPNPTVVEKIIDDKQDKVIRVGIKPIQGIDIIRETKPILFEEKIDLDVNMWEDEQQVIQPGKNGTQEIITTYQLVKGVRQANPKVETRNLIEKEDRIIKKGSKQIHGFVEDTQKQLIPFDIEYVFDDTKYIDEEIVEHPGQVGENKVITRYQTIKGVRQENPTVTINEIKPKINKKIVKGTLLRARPVLEINKISKRIVSGSLVAIEDEDLTKSLKVSTQIKANGRTLESAVYRLFKGNNEVESGNLASELNLENLEYNKEYTLVIEASYSEKGVKEKVEDRQQFILSIPRKIEIKDIDRYELIKYENGRETNVIALNQVPNSYENYFVRVESDRFKSILLPIESITIEQDRFKVNTNIEDLVENRSGYVKGHDFYIAKKPNVESGVYTDFKSLIEAMRLNPTGTFRVGSTLSASEMDMSPNAESYFGTEEFKGTLIGEYNGVQYSIQDLKYPLFSKLNQANIQKLDLKNVDIQLNQSNVGSLAKSAISTTIMDVAVSGSVLGLTNVGGIVSQSTATNYNNIRMDGVVEGTTTLDMNSDVGGLVGMMNGGVLRNGYADVSVRMYGTRGGSRAGALVGRAGDSYAKINGGYAKGTVENTGYGGQIGGVIGSLWWSGLLENIVSEVKVTNGNIAYGDFGDKNANIRNLYTVSGKASGLVYERATSIEEDQANQIVQGYGLTATVDNSDPAEKNLGYEITYTQLKYRNAEKFTPFYLKEMIQHQGDQITDTDLLNKEVISIKPLKDGQIALNESRQLINQILVHFKDGTVKKYDVTYNAESKPYLPEYKVTQLGIVYTLDSLQLNSSSISSTVLNQFKSIEYYSDALAKKVNAYAESEVTAAVNATTNLDQAREKIIADKMGKLYLEDEFKNVKANLDQILPKLIQSDKMITSNHAVIQKAIEDKLVENKEYIVMALAYLSRWYNINFDSFNVKELVLYHQDFFGKDVETIDFLIRLGKLGYNDLRLKNNLNTYKKVISNNTNQSTIFNYLDSLRTKFTTDDANSWFKKTSKAYLTEATPLSTSSINVKIYDKMTKANSPFNEMVLPLLTAQEGIYAISSMNTILFGMYDRYMNMELKETNPTHYAQEVTRVKGLVDRTTIWHRDYYDYWYRILKAEYKPKLERNLVSLDGYGTDRGWKTMSNPNQAIKDFFGPIERLYNSNGAGAYANGSIVHFVVDRALDQYGNSVFTHEMVHNNDGTVYFNGAKRRNRLGAEYFALGLLQAPNNFNHSSLGINSIFDFSAQKNDPNRVQPISPNRYQSQEDLKEYFERLFDVLYTLEYAEAEVMLSKTDEEKKKLLLQVTTYMNGHLPGNTRQELPDGLSLNSIHDLVDNDIISRRGYGVGNKDPYGFTTNGYYQVWMFDPIYSAGENPQGAAGDLMFRRMAYELLAKYGWEQGFVPYVSSQFETHSEVPADKVITDTLAFKLISNGEYSNMAEFKKAMYDQRYNQRHKLKPVTIRWNSQDVVIDSYDKIKSLLNNSIINDLNPTRHKVTTGSLKHLIFSAYLRTTDDFRQSIYKDN